MGDKFVEVQAHALIIQLNVSHRADLTKHYGGYFKVDLNMDNLKVSKTKGSNHEMISMSKDLKLPYSQNVDLNDNYFIDNYGIISLVLTIIKFAIIAKITLSNLSSLQSLIFASNELSIKKVTFVRGEMLDELVSDYIRHEENYKYFITVVRVKFMSLPYKYNTGLIEAVYDRGINMLRCKRITAMRGKLFKFAHASTYPMVNQLGVYYNLFFEQKIEIDAKLRAYENTGKCQYSSPGVISGVHRNGKGSSNKSEFRSLTI